MDNRVSSCLLTSPLVPTPKTYSLSFCPLICAFGVWGEGCGLLKGFISQGPLLSGFWLEFGQWEEIRKWEEREVGVFSHPVPSLPCNGSESSSCFLYQYSQAFGLGVEKGTSPMAAALTSCRNNMVHLPLRSRGSNGFILLLDSGHLTIPC